jgi:trimeric autotransporter adhesin
MSTAHKELLAMKFLHASSLILIAAVAEIAYGTQPPDVVSSDSSFNTAMGSNALLNLTVGTYNTALGYAALYSNIGGNFNTAYGDYALTANDSGNYNTAAGFQALSSNTTGTANAAFGVWALYSNTTGSYNAAAGYEALYVNTTGNFNSASGSYALNDNATGSANTASGYSALGGNTTGTNNTASGYEALYTNTSGYKNTASGVQALNANTTGYWNTAAGVQALYSNTTGIYNTVSGGQALYSNTEGNHNTASGLQALYFNTTGSDNIADGYQAGFKLTTGSNNIDIGNTGVAADSGVIRIGTTPTQIATYIAGVYGTSVSGNAVVVSSTGQLGVTVSSERFKIAIAPMGPATAKLGQLRPVTFRLKSDFTGTRQYGLIAEEVAKVYPELVIRDGSGRIDGVRYDELAPMLLNEMQEQRAQFRRSQQLQERKIDAQTLEIRDLRVLVAGMQAALLKLQPKDELVAER